MNDWVAELRAAIADESGGRPPVVTLATVRDGPAGPVAAARSVVCRDLSDGGAVTVVSDARSRKDGEVAAHPGAAVLFWLPKHKLQVRLSGPAAVLPADDPRRPAAWAKLSDAARSLFAWPPPGRPRDVDATFTEAVPASAPIPSHFDALVLEPAEVETLDLTPHPHLRRTWAWSDGRWTPTTVNP